MTIGLVSYRGFEVQPDDFTQVQLAGEHLNLPNSEANSAAHQAYDVTAFGEGIDNLSVLICFQWVSHPVNPLLSLAWNLFFSAAFRM